MSVSLWNHFQWKHRRKKKRGYLDQPCLRSAVVYSIPFMVCFISHIQFVNGSSFFHPSDVKTDKIETRQFHQTEKRSDDYRFINTLNETIQNGLSTATRSTKDLLSTNHRKSIFMRESNTPIVYNSNKNNSIDVNKLDDTEYSSSWAVKIPDHLNVTQLDGGDVVFRIADELGLINHGSIGHLSGHYLLVHHTFYDHTPHPHQKLVHLRKTITDRLNKHPYVDWVVHETVQKRVKRALELKVSIWKFVFLKNFFASFFSMMGGCFWKRKFRKILTPYGVSTRNFCSEFINF